MEDVVIRAEGLGKKFTIGHQAERQRYEALRDVLARSTRRLLRKGRDMLSGRPVIEGDEVEEFWALRDLNFEIHRGEVVGIIGHNGSGKSTLLKILSRITDPSAGRVEVAGRVASLLEVGTGFHPELTGRENVFLNGSILGMSQAEICRKFDEIVAFAEVEKFLDTPVKHYSSGMYVRLAFGVAAYLEPEILIVDEVLAVGDVEFQQRCLGKMQDVASTGDRTVLVVSHNMTAIAGICSRGLLLEGGRLRKFGGIQATISEYMELPRTEEAAWSWKGPVGDETVEAISASVLRRNGDSIKSHEPAQVELFLRVKKPVFGLVVAWELWSARGQLLGYSGADDTSPTTSGTTAVGDYRFLLEIPPNTLAAGSYLLALDLGIHNSRRIVRPKEISLILNVENIEGIGLLYSCDEWTDIIRPAWLWSRELHVGPMR